jgi:hypothetical protein
MGAFDLQHISLFQTGFLQIRAIHVSDFKVCPSQGRTRQRREIQFGMTQIRLAKIHVGQVQATQILLGEIAIILQNPHHIILG